VWLIAALAGACCVATGALPWHAAVSTTTRVAPILGFLVAITVVAELADAAGVFDAAAVRAARLARGSVRVLFALVVLLATSTTVVLSLDTTAVLLTPVVLALAARLRLPPLPFAMAVVWLANTASLLLPVSNLTNLLAVDRLDISAVHFAAHTWLPALLAVAVTTAVLGIGYRRQLRGHYAVPARFVAPDPVLLRACTLACLVVAPIFLTGIPVWTTAGVAAIVLAALFAARAPSRLRFALLPWRLVLLVEGMFLFIATLGRNGLDDLLQHLAGHDGSPIGVLRISGVGAAASNLFNNLPSYLALERVTDSRPHQLFGLLLGTNLGPLVLLWGSLATLLWHERCKARGVRVSAWQFARLGAAGVPLLVLASWGGLLITR
jgi:arsenical pump membrane protein